MVAAYVALVSLINFLTRILPSFPVSFHRSQIETLLLKANFLLDFVELYNRRETKHLQRRITYAACAAEDIIESYIVKQILSEVVIFRDIGHAFFFRDMLRSIHEMELISEEVMNIQEKKGEEDQQWVVKCSVSDGSSLTSSDNGCAMGLEEDVNSLMEQLVGHQPSRIIIPIVGIGGIGKTTLARNVYEHSYVEIHFHVRTWVTISQDYNVCEIILCLLRGVGADGNGNDDMDRLGEKLYKTLFGRKYLIVLDDIWSSVAWEKIRRFFPDNGNGVEFC